MNDNCVSCHKKSLYKKEEHIDFRIGYIESVGQLCLECYDEIYLKLGESKNETCSTKLQRRFEADKNSHR